MAEHGMEPGRSTATAPANAGPAAAQALEPGKQTLSGNQLVDHAAVCDANPAASGCFLPAQQRGYLVSFYVGRVSEASGACRSALGNLRMENLLEKDTDNFPVIAGIVLDLIGGYALSMISTAVRNLRKAGDEKIRELQKLMQFPESKAAVARGPMQEGLLGLTEIGVGMASKAVVDNVKGGIKGLVCPPQADKKAAALAYVNLLMDQCGLAFMELRETSPGLASDAEMIALYEGFHPSNHKTSHYQTQLREKIDRLTHSNITSIGRDKGARHAGESDQPADTTTADIASPRVIRDVVVVQARFESGYKPGYALASSWWRAAPKAFDGYNGVQLDEPLPMLQGDFKGDKMTALAGGGKQVLGMIDPEFVDVALERQEQMWGSAPESMLIDDSSWFWDPARADRARQNKEKEHPSMFQRLGPMGFGPPKPAIAAPAGAGTTAPAGPSTDAGAKKGTP